MVKDWKPILKSEIYVLYIFKYISTVHVLRKKLRIKITSFSQQDNSKTRIFFERRQSYSIKNLNIKCQNKWNKF